MVLFENLFDSLFIPIWRWWSSIARGPAGKSCKAGHHINTA